jgi:5-deoxy-5-amino-3-dehydroquinate dehydratase
VTDILLLNGPNLGTLGTREPAIYGTTTLAVIEASVRERVAAAGYGLVCAQHDAEHELIRELREHGSVAGAILNPGALMIAGWALRDALASFAPPWIEVHISNVWARETFRHESVLSPLAAGMIVGFGAAGYLLAADALVSLVATRST